MLAESVRVLMRRWLRALLALVVAAGIGIGAYEVIAPGQESSAQVLIVPSIKQPGVNGPTNPFVSLNGSISIVASVVQVAVSDQKTAAALMAEGARAKYTVVPNLAENAGPVLLITVDDNSAAMTQRTLTAVIKEISKQLLKIQVDKRVDPDLYLSSLLLTASDHPLPVHKSQVQKAVIAFFGSLVIFVVVILLVERSTTRRRSTDMDPADTAQAVDVNRDPNATTSDRGPRRRGRALGATPATDRSGSRRTRRGSSLKPSSPGGARARRAKKNGGDIPPEAEMVRATPSKYGPGRSESPLGKFAKRLASSPRVSFASASCNYAD